MLPLSIVFDQLPRAARDIARQLKKRISVDIQSKNSYLDKSIIERLDEQIIHIIRNAIAHGIERPEIRKSLHKKDTEKITITSYMESGNVVIKIKDDGRGINTQAVAEKAVARGLINKEDIPKLSVDEICSFIFLPEVSTSGGVMTFQGVALACIL